MKNTILLFGQFHSSSIKSTPHSVYTIGAFVSENYPTQQVYCPINSIINLEIDSLGRMPDKDNPKIRLQNVYDALYFAGSSKEWITDIAPPIESPYWDELNRRAKIVWGQELDAKSKKK